jgi:HTH-type transcriptional repressor of NAD biosynthesis genes
VDVPWKVDDLRDRPYERQKMFRTFETQLKNYQLQFQILKGSEVERFQSAVEKITELLKDKNNAHRNRPTTNI